MADGELDRLREIEHQLREINHRVGRLPAVVRYLRERDLWAIEVFLLISSCWAASVLLRPPSNFAQFPSAFGIAEMLSRNEQLWGYLVACAAGLKIIGITFYFKHRTIGVVLRCMGLACGGTFWCMMGLSTVIGNPDTLFGFAGFMMGVLSWWSILRVSW
jgi:hypothetical protein